MPAHVVINARNGGTAGNACSRCQQLTTASSGHATGEGALFQPGGGALVQSSWLLFPESCVGGGVHLTRLLELLDVIDIVGVQEKLLDVICEAEAVEVVERGRGSGKDRLSSGR